MTRVYIAAGLRREVRERAGGRCEYCLTPESVSFLSFEPDHIVAQKHGGATEANNLALCCPLCNKHKGTDLASVDPETGVVALLYNPRRDLWRDHFHWVALRLEGTTATRIPLTCAAGRSVRHCTSGANSTTHAGSTRAMR